jgi:hypothetical protein
MTEKERKPRAKRSTMGFQILAVDPEKATELKRYDTISTEKFESLSAAERYIKKNAEQFKDMTLVIAHLKKEIMVKTENKAVATITEVK